MTRRLIDRDPLTGEAVWYEYQSSDDSATITHTQEVDDIIERNVAAANDADKTQRGIKRDWWHYADIPHIVWMQWKNETGHDLYAREHRDELFKKLNSPEYRYLKLTSKHHE